MKLLAIDPANKESAFVLMEDYKPLEFDKRDNEDVLGVVKAVLSVHPDCHVAIEMVASYGLPVGKDVFETCVYIGRLIEHCNSWSYVYRKDVKMNLCHQLKQVNDTTIRHALIDRFAKHDFRSGKGTKKNKDFFYGFKADVWAAYAVGVTYLDSLRGYTK